MPYTDSAEVLWAVLQVVGFEIMACSIQRKAGAPIEAISCVSNEDKPPSPQPVVKGGGAWVDAATDQQRCLSAP